jgi:hypothetical protein
VSGDDLISAQGQLRDYPAAPPSAIVRGLSANGRAKAIKGGEK